MKKSASKSKISNSAELSKGFLIILSAPSGCGKTTLVDRLLKRHPDWVRSISLTTRQPRVGEKDGVDYFFVTPKRFKEMQAQDELLESAQVYDWMYGTPKNFVEKHLADGKKVILAIDVQGTKKIKKVFDGTGALISIFILPPSVKILRERLEGRKTEEPAEIERRMEVAQEEIKEAGLYDLTFVNQNLEQTIAEIEDGIEKFEKIKKAE